MYFPWTVWFVQRHYYNNAFQRQRAKKKHFQRRVCSPVYEKRYLLTNNKVPAFENAQVFIEAVMLMAVSANKIDYLHNSIR